ncbi:alpha/beta fold hydrolase [Citromicrobium sp. WPS32]|uniref:alpha/beta fold hydrolase n=1 Tax=Citromicrobium sp. WPS32 TaxID=1634517 RepID=UPI0006C91009|nr:alpha/beta hydrolase [Citromicrobium sp. WPS32]MAY78297.1 poly(3-hydroxyalkanoate) depolymerase [Citromicrobium sp.]|tara:strand:+ start:579 stop:1481 length:903 start_codon:yes stop_codon:yes gene_type:complete
MMRFTDMDLRLPGWGLFGGTARSQPSKHLRGKPGGPLSADVSFETVDGIELRVARWRLDAPCAHPPLLFFNGIGANIEAVAPLAETLTDRGFIMFDMPGTGESPDPVLPYNPFTMSSTAAGVLKRFGLETVDVMGMSWGGAMAQQFALQYTSRVRRVVLAATSPGMLMIPGDPAMLAQMADPFSGINAMLRSEYLMALENADETRRARHSIGNITPPSSTGYFYQLMALAGWTSLPALPFLDKPVLVMMGENDPIVPLANGRLLAGAIPDARLEVFEGAGHLFLMTHPERAIDLLREFLG